MSVGLSLHDKGLCIGVCPLSSSQIPSAIARGSTWSRQPFKGLPTSHVQGLLTAVASTRHVLEWLVLSCMKPFVVLHRNKGVLRPRAYFLSKMVSSIHPIGQILLPSFPKLAKKVHLHCLDVVHAVKVSYSIVQAIELPLSLQEALARGCHLFHHC